MRIAIIGTGAMGSLFAARLSGVAEVVMIGSWPEQLAALKKGLTHIAFDGTTTMRRIPAFSDVREVARVDMVLILVKSYQTQRAVQQAKVLLDVNGPLNLALTLQNGAGNHEIMASALGDSRSFLGITNQAATIEEPGTVRDTGPGAVYLGNAPEQDQKTEVLRELFTAAGFTVERSNDIRSLVWGKLAVNAAINPLTAILNRPNGYVGEQELPREIMFRLAREVAAVAAAQGISMPYADVEQQVLEVSRATAANTSSMLRDVLRGARTEIDAICGEVVKKGAQYGVSTPVNSIIFDAVRAIENGERAPGTATDLSRILERDV